MRTKKPYNYTLIELVTRRLSPHYSLVSGCYDDVDDEAVYIVQREEWIVRKQGYYLFVSSSGRETRFTLFQDLLFTSGLELRK